MRSEGDRVNKCASEGLVTSADVSPAKVRASMRMGTVDDLWSWMIAKGEMRRSEVNTW